MSFSLYIVSFFSQINESRASGSPKCLTMNFFSSSPAVAYRDSACDCALHNKHCCSGSCFEHDGCRFLEQEDPLCLLISSEDKTRDETVIKRIKKIPFCLLTIVTFHPTIYYI